MVKVFISYSHDSPEHCGFVRNLSDSLRRDGLDCQIDLYITGFPPEGWQLWMEKQVEQADFVLLVCTHTYLRRYRGEERIGGHGVTFEGAIISQTLYDHYGHNPKFIPIIPDSGSLDNVPLPLKRYSTYCLPDDYGKLYRLLTKQPEYEAPIVGELLSLNPKPGSSNQASPPKQEAQSNTYWACYTLSREGEMVRAENEDGMGRSLPAERLRLMPTDPPLSAMGELIFGAVQNWERFLRQFPSQTHIRLRIMTDDAELAMLPWQRLRNPETGLPLLDSGWAIETGSVILAEQLRFANITPSNPLLVIPKDAVLLLNGKSHHNLLQQHLHSELGVIGSIQQVHSTHSVRHALKYHEPDLIYIYAPFDGQYIQLDPDPRSIDSAPTMTLEQLGEWLQEFKLYPIVVLSLLGHPPQNYPATLVKNSLMVWLQQDSRNTPGATRLGDNLLDILTKIPNDSDILKVIMRSSLKLAVDNAHHIWVNGNTPLINLSDRNQPHYSRLRAALLRVMLGRKSIKDQLYGAITHSDNFDKQAFLVFAISGNADACPFEFPAQLRSRLQWEDIRNRLPVIQFDFPLSIIRGTYHDLKAAIEAALDENMRHNHNDIGEILERQRVGWRGQNCCILLNWLVEIDELDDAVLRQWLGVWQRTLYHELVSHIPDQTVLVAVTCLQLPDEDSAQQAQHSANDALYETKVERIQTIGVEDALGRLKALEIRQFLDKGTRWYSDLKLAENGVEPQAYARWIHQRTQGRFEQTVDHLWQQYQRHYQDYLAT